MIELILHVGMGKTGTSSIQAALGKNAAHLRGQGVEYLGLWFGLISSDFVGYEGQKLFFSSSPEEMREHADTFKTALYEKSEETGSSRFILSNESMFGQVSSLIPLIERLRESVSVKIVAYARNPNDWLPSAYNQWGIYHKTSVGSIPDYATFARKSVKTYAGLISWGQSFPDEFTIRPFQKGLDVLSDFCGFCDITIETDMGRRLERASVVENVFRTVYNDRYEGAVLPNRFNAIVGGGRVFSGFALGEIIDRSFDYSETECIVGENSELFEAISRLTGVNLSGGSYKIPDRPEEGEVRKGVMDALVRIVMDQSDKINALERRIKRLEGDGQ